MGYRVKVRQYPMRGRNGDRATVDTSYTRYEVVIEEARNPKSFVVAGDFSSYDSFNSSIRDDRKRAEDLANRLAEFFDDGAPTWVAMRQKPVEPQPIEWEEIQT